MNERNGDLIAFIAALGAIVALAIIVATTPRAAASESGAEPGRYPAAILGSPSLAREALVAAPLSELSLDGSTPEGTSVPVSSGAVASGKASYVGQKYGRFYLALPGGPGIRVRICSDLGCIVRTSTDAGPDKAMQRAGRVADLSWWDFRRLCDCRPETVGLLRVRVVYRDIQLPPTDP